MARKPARAAALLEDVRGGVRLVIDGVGGVTGIVESMHQRIAGLSPPVGVVPDSPARGVSGLVYRSIRGTTGLVGKGLDAALAGVQAMLQATLRGLPQEEHATPGRDAVVAALNGVVGDHLERTGNPLAVRMALRVDASGAGRADRPVGPRVLLLIHGLCMNDLQWLRGGHDHGQALARDRGFTPVYLRYNSGRHVSVNGGELAEALDELLRGWRVPVESVTIIGHSMGGLVARSAVHQALQAGMDWPARVDRMVFLGTPHHGAPLERAGNWLHRGLGVSPYLAPFTRLSGLRSAGITDLRHGNLLEQDWATRRFDLRDSRCVVPLPQGVSCFAIAGTLGRLRSDRESAPDSVRTSSEAWLGDGLVPLSSALGRHPKPTRDLHLPASRIWIGRGINHLDLLGSQAVYRRLRRWLA